ncbi:MAG: hypothetical protein GY751_01765, partial [Bacteroidetes bacterium]|nr:hypothetical protein [Bacteroidota bacterium]
AISIENILGNDVDVDGDSFEFVSFGATRNGEIITNPDGSYIFKPNANYNSSDGNSFDRASAYHHGEAGFQYTIRDEYDAEQTGWVKVQVNAVNDAPSVEGHVITYDDLASTPYPDGNPVVQGYSTIIDIDSDLTTLSVCHSTSTSFSITDQSFDDMQNEARLSYNYVGIYSFSSHWVDGEPSGHYVTSVSYVTSVFTVTLNDSGLVSNNIWLGASHGVCIGDPIVFDLDGDGVELLGTDHGVTFDTNNDGVAENIGWVSPDDGFLVWDRNQDGLVDDFNELNFTDVHPDAFTDLDAMSLYFDSNQDGVFNASDDHWDEFGVWNDANSNGVTDEGEFTSMEEAGIASVNVEGQDVNYDQDGNQVVGETEYTDSDGESHEAKVVFLDIEEGSMGESGLEIAAADYQPLDAETAAIFQQADAINSMMAAEALTIPEDVTAMPIAADMPVYEYAAEEECYSVG